MRYFIMLLIVLGLAASDIVTGWLKAHAANDYCSAVMRRGGLRKLAEILVMLTACGLETGLKYLGTYDENAELAALAGSFTAAAVFMYIVVMELISIMENYAKLNPDAAWALRFLRKLRSFQEDRDKDQEEDQK